MLKLIVILSYNSIIRSSAGFYISILGMWLILCGAYLIVERSAIVINYQYYLIKSLIENFFSIFIEFLIFKVAQK
jgi:hypothetical protein